MNDTAREWAERARKAQKAVNDLGVGHPAGRVTRADRDLAARALELAALSGAEIRGQSGYDDPVMALADFAGRAQQLLFELAGIITRLDGQAAAQTTEAGHG